MPNKKEEVLDLLHKELDVNTEEQKLLKKRAEQIKSVLVELGKDDPEYPLYQSQILADKVFLDELILEEEAIRERIEQN